MDADFSYKEETDQIIGSAFAVLNEIGHGYHEKPYENGLAVEFRFREIPFAQQSRYPILYRGVQISEFVPDLIAFGKIIVETKVLKVTGLPVGLILNFKNPKLEFRRVVSSTQKFLPRSRQ